MSKFTAAMNAAKERGIAVIPAEPEVKPVNVRQQEQPSAPAPVAVRRGRPAGKRSSASNIQVTAYIDSTTHVETKIRLLQNARRFGQKQDFSGLVQQLLTEWLDSQK